MSEHNTSVAVLPKEELASAENTTRDAKIRALLGTDYEFAKDSGLVDVFYYDAETQQDGLLHTLSGNSRIDQEGRVVVEGFHHEPSADIGSFPVKGTRVDREHLEGANSSKRRTFAEQPYEPYYAKVEIEGRKKRGTITDKETGEKRVTQINNGMYPKEYDPLAVMQAVRLAKDERDKSKDQISETDQGREVIVSETLAPMLDGEHKFKIRLVLDRDTEKVITAMPYPRPGIMKLSSEAIKQHLGLQLL